MKTRGYSTASTMFSAPLAGICAATMLMLACSGADEQGKYQSGKKDPALGVKTKDIAEVRALLDKQIEKDKAAGLRKETPDPHAGMAMPPGESAAAAPPKADPNAVTPVGASGKRISVGSLWCIVPEGWMDKPPSSPMRLAEISIPATPGDPEPGQVSIFFFGPDQGGTAEMNLNRWYGQMEQPDGKDSKSVAHLESLKAGTMDVTLVDLTGTMLPSNMPGGAGSSKRQENWRMLAAIIQSAEGPYFVKGTGPAKTMEDNKAKMIQFVTSFAAQ